MKRLLFVLITALASVPNYAADVGVSVAVGQPGFYGRIDMGDMPHPELLYRQAIIVRPVAGVVYAPIYLHVPPGHAKEWAKHCHKYGACAERVYFVNGSWYNDVYVLQYQKRHGKPAGHNHGKGNGKHKD